MPRKLAGFGLAICMTAVVGLAQTATELLQKGIFAQETEGNLDNAILIYRQIVNSAPTQRDLAAQAQYRLAQVLLQKGDLNLAAQEFAKLARDYSDYQNLVSKLATQARGTITPGCGGFVGDQLQKCLEAQRLQLDAQKAQLAERTAKFAAAAAQGTFIPGNGAGGGVGAGLGSGPGGRNGGPSPEGLASLTFDPNRPVTIRGKAIMVMFAKPVGVIMVDPGTGTERYRFSIASANQMMNQGFTRDTIKPGDEIVVNGILAAGGAVEEGPKGRVIGAQATTVSLANGALVFDRTKIQEAAK